MTDFQDGAAANAAGLRDAFEMMASHSAERFEQIGALCQTLQLLLKSPQFHDMPWLAVAQLDALIFLADGAAADVDATARRFIPARTRPGV